MKNIYKILKSYVFPFVKKYYIYLLLLAVIAILGLRLNYVSNKKNTIIETPVVVKDGTNGTYSQIGYSDDDFKALKEENKALYDSLKSYKNKVNFVAQFKYSKTYEMDTVYVDSTSTRPIQTFEYANALNDSINYNLKIGSETVPAWYLLKVKVSDQFTIVNKNENSLNETSIDSQNKGELSDVTIFNKNTNKTSWYKRFAIGPSVTGGYSMHNKNFDVMIGVSCTYNLLK